jgi:hypothetical protein
MKSCKILVMAFAVLLSAAYAMADQSNWWGLSSNEEYVDDFVIQAKEVKSVTIPSDAKQRIMFMVDVNDEPLNVIKSGPFPIEMTDLGSRKKVTSFWSGLDCVPVKGQIKLNIKNVGKKEYREVVVKVKK